MSKSSGCLCSPIKSENKKSYFYSSPAQKIGVEIETAWFPTRIEGRKSTCVVIPYIKKTEFDFSGKGERKREDMLMQEWGICKGRRGAEGVVIGMFSYA